MIQSASTPPPSPPSAAIRMVTGRSGNAMVSGRLEPADDPGAQAIDPAVEDVRVLHDLGAEERRAQHRRVRHLPAQAAAYAGVVDVRHRVGLERVAGGLDGER